MDGFTKLRGLVRCCFNHVAYYFLWRINIANHVVGDIMKIWMKALKTSATLLTGHVSSWRGENLIEPNESQCSDEYSDILTELDFPASGISRLEGWIAFPKGHLSLSDDIHRPSEMMMLYYSTQIYLRKFLNRTQEYLYNANCKYQNHAKYNANHFFRPRPLFVI